MQVTEKEAREKMCPMVRSQANCIGTGCMAWVFTTEMRDGTPGRKFVATPSPVEVEPDRPEGIPVSWLFVPYEDNDGDPSGWIEPYEDYLARRVGRCGVVCRPEGM